MPSHLSVNCGLAIVNDLSDKPFTSDFLSALEPADMLARTKSDFEKDRVSSLHRTGNARLQTELTIEKEHIMNPRNIIASIERNRTIMEAQFEKLSEVSLRMGPLSMNTGNAQSDAASPLSTYIRGHMQGVADALHAISEVETSMRRQSNDSASGLERPRTCGHFIDVETVAIDKGRVDHKRQISG